MKVFIITRKNSPINYSLRSVIIVAKDKKDALRGADCYLDSHRLPIDADLVTVAEIGEAEKAWDHHEILSEINF